MIRYVNFISITWLKSNLLGGNMGTPCAGSGEHQGRERAAGEAGREGWRGPCDVEGRAGGTVHTRLCSHGLEPQEGLSPRLPRSRWARGLDGNLRWPGRRDPPQRVPAPNPQPHPSIQNAPRQLLALCTCAPPSRSSPYLWGQAQGRHAVGA